MLVKVILVVAVFLVMIACGASEPVSPEQAAREAVAEQTKTWEKTRDSIHEGWDEEERISGEHCEYADDEYHPSFQLAELVKAQLEYPDTFDAKLGKKGQEGRSRDFFMYSLDGEDVRKFDIPMSEFDIENIRYGGKLTPLTHSVPIPSEYDGIWADRPKHYATLTYRVEFEPDKQYSPYSFLRADAFVDHWNCSVKLLGIAPIQ